MNVSGTNLLSLLLVGVIAITNNACTKQNPQSISASFIGDSFAQDNSFVGLDRVIDRFGSEYGTTKSSSHLDIQPVISESNDTALYILNYGHNKGWKLISSDVRTPAILAESHYGAFSLEDGNPGLSSWIDCLVKDMSDIRHSPDSKLSFSEEEIAANKAFWGDGSRGIIIPGDGEGPGGGDDGGHWYIHGESETVTYDTSHFDVPHWDQYEPYNKYCPYKSGNTTFRVPAGCVAIAGAQALYSYHQKLGVPQMTFSMATCTGDENNYSRTFTAPTSTVWDDMKEAYDDTTSRPCYEAVLIAYVGYLVRMDYSSNGSSASMEDLRTDVFIPMGLNCSYGAYNETLVRDNLIMEKPVVVRASNSVLPIFDWGSSHCFVLDGYKRTRIKTTTYYEWVPDIIGDPGGYFHRDYSTVSYSSPVISYVHINWGWWTQWKLHYNDGWYAITGDWLTHDSGGSPAGSYNYYRSMIYNFSLY